MEPFISYCSVSWDLHKNYLSNGFSHLQKNEEFVDMTIAAEGYLVKVHQNIIALASPYFKEMLHSASCPHPVVFLNNVSHKTLSYILEYIYTGEVRIPTDDMNEFIETSKALRIKGVENVLPVNMPNEVFSSDVSYFNAEPEMNDDTVETKINASVDSHCAAHITINSSNYQVNVHKATTNHENHHNINSENNELTNNLMEVCREDTPQSTTDYNVKILPFNRNNDSHFTETDSFENDNFVSFENDEPETLNVKEKINQNVNIPLLKSVDMKSDLKMKDIKPQYTISNRGALQLILNRYMYLCHHSSHGGRKRRWRCADYRRMQCPAIVDTIDDNVTNRTGLHSHGFHDVKILKKYRKHAVYTKMSDTKIKNNDKEESDEDITKNKIKNNI